MAPQPPPQSYIPSESLSIVSFMESRRFSLREASIDEMAILVYIEILQLSCWIKVDDFQHFMQISFAADINSGAGHKYVNVIRIPNQFIEGIDDFMAP